MPDFTPTQFVQTFGVSWDSFEYICDQVCELEPVFGPKSQVYWCGKPKHWFYNRPQHQLGGKRTCAHVTHCTLLIGRKEIIKKKKKLKN